MARQSKCHHLKSAVEDLYKQGKTPHEVVSIFNELPLRTAKDWYSRIVQENPQAIEPAKTEENKKIFILNPPKPPQFEVDENLEDIEWVKRSCKAIIRAEKNNAIRIQALNCFLKAVQLSEPLKEEEVVLSYRKKFSEMSSTELTALYRQMLGKES